MMLAASAQWRVPSVLSLVHRLRLADSGVRGHWRCARSDALIDTKIVAAKVRAIIRMPYAAVIKREKSSGGYRQYRSFHVSLLAVEIFRETCAGIVHIIDTARAREIRGGRERGFCRHSMIGVIAWID